MSGFKAVSGAWEPSTLTSMPSAQVSLQEYFGQKLVHKTIAS